MSHSAQRILLNPDPDLAEVLLHHSANPAACLRAPSQSRLDVLLAVH